MKGSGDRGKAEAELARRAERVKALHIRPLEPAQRARFADAWRADQARFVDDPTQAVAEADRLVGELMQARGYPVGDFEQRAADVSVDHPHVVENYRTAHDIAVRQARGEADTEALRKAMVHYRALFDDLLDSGPASDAQPRADRAVPLGDRVAADRVANDDVRREERVNRPGNADNSDVRRP